MLAILWDSGQQLLELNNNRWGIYFLLANIALNWVVLQKLVVVW
jgi:hypothetical protein